MKKLSAILSVVMLLAFSGCASLTKRQACIVKSAVAGMAIGSTGGVIVGNQGDNDNKLGGGLIGAAAGAIIGGTIGCFVCEEEVKEAKVMDSDGDGVIDSADKCPATPRGVKVDSTGCPVDSDGDGVVDYKDKCPGTPSGVTVDATGCPVDSDGDGVPDSLDKCPDTPKDLKVDAAGCPPDSDGDGVPDYIDQCPSTPKGAEVNKYGCWAFYGSALFDTNKFEVRADARAMLDNAVKILKDNPDMKIEIRGYTDNTGSAAYNLRLSEKRAQAVKDYLVAQGIEASRLVAKGYGESNPTETNDTPEGRQRNRRVEFRVIR